MTLIENWNSWQPILMKVLNSFKFVVDNTMGFKKFQKKKSNVQCTWLSQPLCIATRLNLSIAPTRNSRGPVGVAKFEQIWLGLSVCASTWS
jgi:hypothetical protein